MVELTGSVAPDAEAFLANLRREGTPKRVHFMELFLDLEIKQAVCERFGLIDDLSEDDPYFAEKREVAVQRFLGYEYVYTSLGVAMPLKHIAVEDTAALAHEKGRQYMEEHKGPITSWEE